MKRLGDFFILLLFAVLSASTALAQLSADSGISSLLKSLQAAGPDSNKVKVYVQLANYYKATKPDSAYYFVAQGMLFANSIHDKQGKAGLLDLTGILDEDKGMVNKAKQDYLDALAVHKEINNKQAAAKDYTHLGRISISKGDYTNATTYYIDGMKLFEEIGDKAGLGGATMGMGMMSEEMGDNNKALSYLLKTQAIYNTLPFAVYHLQLMNNLGMLYNNMGKRDTAITILRMAIAKSAAPQYASVRSQLYCNAGTVLYAMGDVKEAIKCTDKSLELAKENGLKSSECYSLVNIADMRTDDPKRSLANLKEALAISQEVGQKHLEANIYGELADFYKKNGSFAEALSATQHKYALLDSLLDNQKNVAVADLQSTYELEKSKEHISILELKNSRDEFKAKLVIAIAVGVVLLLIVGGFNYRRIAMLNRLLNELNKVTTAQKDELRELNNVKDKIFSVIGHDLRGPLGSTIGMMQLIEEDHSIDEESKMMVETLKAQALANLDTLDKLLYWGKKSFKGTVVQQQVFVVDTILKGNIALLAATAQQKHIQVTDSVPPGEQLYADVSHFDFVTRNLLSNALKFTPDGGSISVGLAADPMPGFTVFAIHDTGVGMTQEEQDHLFSLDNTSKIGTQEEVGTGIGLLLCKEFVQKNGGQLWVESIQGEGSTFYFSFKSAETT